MSLPRFEKDLNIIGGLPDDPAISSDDFKSKFDQAGKLIKDFLNGTGDYSGEGLIHAIEEEITSKLSNLKPVGSLYITLGDENPHNIFGGTWEKLHDVYLKASGTSNAGTTGGSNTKTILKENLPNYNLTVTDPGHDHDCSETTGNIANDFDRTFNRSGVTDINKRGAKTGRAYTGISVNSGGSGAEFNIEPSHLNVNIWKRTA